MPTDHVSGDNALPSPALPYPSRGKNHTAPAKGIFGWVSTPPDNLTPEQRLFYDNYDPMEGVTTASVLGGFFVFVCLIVVYKTKMKPKWKERRKKLYNTPATRSEVESSFSHIHKDFECIPLQTMRGCDDEEEDDIYYLDEYGNYVFPLSPTLPGSCSCPHR